LCLDLTCLPVSSAFLLVSVLLLASINIMPAFLLFSASVQASALLVEYAVTFFNTGAGCLLTLVLHWTRSFFRLPALTGPLPTHCLLFLYCIVVSTFLWHCIVYLVLGVTHCDCGTFSLLPSPVFWP
jgi:hypothetical protein